LRKVLEGQKDGSFRLAAAISLVELGQEEEKNVLSSFIIDRRSYTWELGVEAAKALKRLFNPGRAECDALIAPLLEKLEVLDYDSSARVQASVDALTIFCIAKIIGANKVVDGFVGLLAHENPEVWRKASFRIEDLQRHGELRGSNALGSLTRALGHDKRWVKTEAARLLGVLGDKGAVGPLVAALGDRSHEVREQAAKALGKLGWQPQDARQRAYYAVAQGRVDDALKAGPIAAEVFRPLVKGDHPYYRKVAIKSLGELKDAESIDLFSESIREYDEEIRIEAARALGSLASERARQELEAALLTEHRRGVAGIIEQELVKLRPNQPSKVEVKRTSSPSTPMEKLAEGDSKVTCAACKTPFKWSDSHWQERTPGARSVMVGDRLPRVFCPHCGALIAEADPDHDTWKWIGKNGQINATASLPPSTLWFTSSDDWWLKRKLPQSAVVPISRTSLDLSRLQPQGGPGSSLTSNAPKSSSRMVSESRMAAIRHGYEERVATKFYVGYKQDEQLRWDDFVAGLENNELLQLLDQLQIPQLKLQDFLKINELVYALVRLGKLDSVGLATDKVLSIYEESDRTAAVYYKWLVKIILEPWSSSQEDRAVINATKTRLERLLKLMGQFRAKEVDKQEARLWLVALEDFESRENIVDPKRWTTQATCIC